MSGVIDITLSLQSREYQQRLAQAASGTGQFASILTRTASVVGRVEDRMSFASTAADDLARRIEGQTDGFDRLRSNVEALSDRLKIFGERGNQMASAIEGISDPARRAAVAQREFDRAMNPSRLDRLAASANDAQAEMGLFMARLGPLAPLAVAGAGAVAGLALAIGSGLVSATQAYVASNTLAQREVGELTRAFDRLTVAVGEATWEAGDLGRVSRGSASILDDLTDYFSKIEEGAEGAGGRLYDFGEAMGDAGEAAAWIIAFPIAANVRAIGWALGFIADQAEPLPWVWGQVDTLRDSLENLQDAASDAAASLERSFGGALNNTLTGLDALIGKTREAADTLRWEMFARSTPLGREGKAGPLMPTGEFDTGFLSGPLTAEGRFAGPERERQGGGGGAKEQATALTASLKDLLSVGGQLQDLSLPAFEGTAVTLESLALTLQKGGLAAQLDAVGTALYDASQVLQEGFATTAFQQAIADALAMKAAFDQLAEGIKSGAVDAFVSLTDASFQAFGAFAVGEGSIKGLGDAMLDTVGSIMSSFADLFLKAGAGMIILDPAIGLGLIGAGAALKVAAGAASAKGSANATGGSSGGAAREIERVADRLGREANGARAQTQPQILLIGDREFRGFLVESTGDAVRRRQLGWGGAA